MSVKIIRGEDRNLTFNINKKDGNFLKSFDLTGYTKIQVVLSAFDNSKLIIDNIAAHGRFASIVYEGVTYTADSLGDAGNSIVLDFDGIKTIEEALDEWNNANPSNTASSDAEDETEVPSAATVQLEGGLDNYSKVEVLDDINGKIKVTLDNDDTNKLAIGTNQAVGFIIDFGEHDLGNRRKAVAKNAIDVISENF